MLVLAVLCIAAVCAQQAGYTYFGHPNAPFLSLALFVVLSHYPTAPDAWSQSYPDCGQADQSPVNLPSTSPLSNLSGLFVFYSAAPTPLLIFNEGSTVSLFFPNNTGAISGAGLQAPIYTLAKVSFRWGLNDTLGSEHYIDGVAFPLEAQLIHYDASYSSYDEALSSMDPGAVVIASVLFQLSPNPNGQLAASIEALAAASSFSEGNGVTLDAFSLGYFASMLTPQSPFLKYTFVSLSPSLSKSASGSLTAPSCNPGVTWIVMQTPNNVSSDQVAAWAFVSFTLQLSTLRAVYRNLETQDLVAPNARPLQPLGSRQVQRFEPTVACSLTPWTAWSPCENYCGVGSQFQTRTVVAQASVRQHVQPHHLI
jgi:carbonic anhydrase